MRNTPTTLGPSFVAAVTMVIVFCFARGKFDAEESKALPPRVVSSSSYRALLLFYQLCCCMAKKISSRSCRPILTESEK